MIGKRWLPGSPTRALTSRPSVKTTASGLALAFCMLKQHPRRGLWGEKAKEFMISAYATAADVQSRRVVDGKVTMDMDYLSAIEEGKYVIAQANAALDKDGKLTGDLVSHFRTHQRTRHDSDGQCVHPQGQ